MFDQVLLENMGNLRRLQKPRTPKVKGSSPSLAEASLEVRVAIRGALFMMEHHPFEVRNVWWLAHDPNLCSSANVM